jgi:hypothetical protein
MLVLYTDGLTDRRGAQGSDVVTLLAPAASGRLTPAEVVAALVLAADSVGPAEDDTSVLVALL